MERLAAFPFVNMFILGFGLEKAIGHADFYPNGGTDQPGCPDKMYKHLFHLITGKFKGLFFPSTLYIWINVNKRSTFHILKLKFIANH